MVVTSGYGGVVEICHSSLDLYSLSTKKYITKEADETQCLQVKVCVKG